MKQKLICILIAIVLVISFVPTTALAAELDCSSFVSDAAHRSYINMMMQYYISTRSELKTTLSNGKSVVFMFEGGSDNYSNNSYSSNGNNIRNQAVVIVVQQKDGKNQIVFFDENCSSIPSQPQDTSGGSCDRQTTIFDGVYKIQTCNHNGQYGALNVLTSKGYYTPSTNKDGWENSASGINIHTRSTTNAGSGNGAWSWGCQLIGTGNSSSNAFNNFMKIVVGIDYNVWSSFSSKQFAKVTAGIDVGYYVLDRQLAYDGLKQIYTETALKNITASSRSAKLDASDNYMAKCTSLPSYGTISITATKTYVKSLPCSKATNTESADVEVASKDTTYTAVGLYKNDQGNLWYKVLTSTGVTGYIFAGDTKFVDQKYDDYTLTGVSAPTEIVYGKPFSIKGVISTKYQQLTSVGAMVCQNNKDKTGTVLSVNTNSYSLYNSAVDQAVLFNKLDVGEYTYMILAGAKSYCATSATAYKELSSSIILHNSTFTVVGNASCSHAYSSQVTKTATCSECGERTYTCNKCGNSYKESISATGTHTYGDWIVTKYASCVTTGIEQRECTGCSAVESRTSNATGHSYGSWITVKDPGCDTYGAKKRICPSCTSEEWESINATGHKWDAGEVTKKPTALETGIRTFTCATCKATRTEEIAKLEVTTQGVTRLAGSDRYKTAFLAADMLKEQLGAQKFDVIVVASGTEFADALSGSYLAAVKNAPMLLVRNNKATLQHVKDYIKANLKSGGTVYILGGENAVPKSMESGLEGFTVKRLGGATRYDTNLIILKEAGVGDKDILVCTGKGFADSLSASAAERPILLAKDSLSTAQKDFLKGTSGKKYVIGGTSAVSDKVESALKAYGEVKRLGGNTRYETSVLVAREFFSNPTSIVLAYAQNFPDGLSGGALAAGMNAPLILTASGKDAAATQYAENMGINSGFVMGGNTLISDKAVNNVFSAAKEQVT